MGLGSSQFRIWFVIAIAFLSHGAAAQRGSSGSTNNPSRTAAPPRTATTPDTSLRPLFVSGKVLLEGGGSLPEPVAIERICGGVPRREGYTDVKGQFDVQLGSTITFQDASESDSRTSPAAPSRPGSGGGRRPFDLSGCELRAVLAGYQSSTVILRLPEGDSWQIEVGPLFLKRLGNAPGTTISVTSMAAPKDAMRAYEKAQKIKADKPDEAEKHLNKAVQIYPQFAAAWSLLGDIHRQRNEFAAATTEYQRSVAADPQFVNPIYGLTTIAMQEKKWDEAIHLSEQVLKLNASAYPMAYFFNAAANYNLGKFDAAEESAKKFKALDIEHSHPDVCLLLSYVLSRKQDYAGAAREIREFLAASPNSPDAETLKADAKRFEDLSVSAKRE
jgi:Tfp pilus assembly protein PilF